MRFIGVMICRFSKVYNTGWGRSVSEKCSGITFLFSIDVNLTSLYDHKMIRF